MSPSDLLNFPLLDASGAAVLRFLREHPSAPRFTHPGCDRLSAAGLERVRAFDAKLRAPLAGWRHGEVLGWLDEFATACARDVPFYRAYGTQQSFFDIPPCSRDDLQREPWSFVPDPLPLDDLVIYQTSGTTGHPLDILTHPESLAMYVPLLRAALATRSVQLDDLAGRVGVVCVCFQRRTWTYAAVLPALGQAGYAKLNLNPADWRAPSDRVAFLDACDAQLYTGDPLSFMELARLPLNSRPRALVSTAMALAPALRDSLERHFGCPVLDLYSTNETGPVAVSAAQGFRLLQPRLYVEILAPLDGAPGGAPCPPGTRGEVVVSGGFNPFLPLLRYRTGDFASMSFEEGVPVLVGLEGRPPVVFRAADGRLINNIDISNALKPFGLAQYALHQSRDGGLRLRVRAAAQSSELADEFAAVRLALLDLFGASQSLRIEEFSALEPSGDKLVQYTRDE